MVLGLEVKKLRKVMGGRIRLGLLIVLAALGSSSALGWLLFRGSSAKADIPRTEGSTWMAIERGDFEVSYSEDGQLLPVKVTTIGFTVKGKIAWIVPEGTRVKKGEKVISLDTTELEDEIKRLEDEFSVAERNLAQQEQTREIEIKRLETEMLAEKDRLALARLREQDVLSHPTDLEKEEAANLLKGGEARLAAARAERDALAPLIEQGFAQRADLEAKELSFQQAEVELNRARMKSRQILDGKTPEERARAGLDRSLAEIAFKQKELEQEEKSANIEMQLRNAQRNVKRAKERLDERRERLTNSVRSAPHDGIVAYRSIGFHDQRKVQVGDYVSTWASPLDLPSYDTMKVRTQVPESIVRKLTARRGALSESVARDSEGRETRTPAQPAVPGSSARVRIKTLAGKVYPAEVTWIDGWARDRNAKLSDADVKSQGLSGVRVFDVEVELKESDPERLREGFRATVEFPIETLRDVIAIPGYAVTLREGRATALVDRGGSPKAREVALGAESNGRVVVKDGLKEGERILVPPAPPQPPEQESASPAASIGTQAARPAPPGMGGSMGPASPSGSHGERRSGSSRRGGSGGSEGGESSNGSSTGSSGESDSGRGSGRSGGRRGR